MSNTAQDFLSQAKVLQAAAANEMEHRTAANRGYYSVYHHATDIKNQLNLPDANNPRGGKHAQLYSALEECRPRHSTKNLEVRQFGIMASRLLKPYRVHADYHIHLEFSKKIMDEVIAKAEFLTSKAGNIITEHHVGTTPQTPNKPTFKIVK